MFTKDSHSFGLRGSQRDSRTNFYRLVLTTDRNQRAGTARTHTSIPNSDNAPNKENAECSGCN